MTKRSSPRLPFQRWRRRRFGLGGTSACVALLVVGCGSLIGVDDFSFVTDSSQAGTGGTAVGEPSSGGTSGAGMGPAGTGGSLQCGLGAGAEGLGHPLCAGAGAPGSGGAAGQEGAGASGAAGTGGGRTGGEAAAGGQPFASGGSTAGEGCGGASTRDCGEGGVGPPTCDLPVCGGGLWPQQPIPYRIILQAGEYAFDEADLRRIERVRLAWTTDGQFPAFVTLEPCEECDVHPRWLEIYPGATSTGISEPTASGAQSMFLAPGDSDYVYAHQMGHVLGMHDILQRPDRDRHLPLQLESCAGSPVHPIEQWQCGFVQSSQAHGRIPSGLFGSMDLLSVMNPLGGLTCNGSVQVASSLPSWSDRINLNELYYTQYGWAPFVAVTTAKEQDEPGPFVYELAPGVGILGSPAVCSRAASALDVFVRGSDHHVYHATKQVSSDEHIVWSPWVMVGQSFMSDPACVYAGGTRVVAGLKADGRVYFATATDDVEADWTSVGAPDAGAFSAPAVTSWGEGRLDVFVRGGDDRLHHRALDHGSWGAWERIDVETPSGRPTAVSSAFSTIDVVVRDGGGTFWAVAFSGSWETPRRLHAWSSHDGALVSRSPQSIDLFMAGTDGQLWQLALTQGSVPFPLGGHPWGSPAAWATGPDHIDIVAPHLDGRALGLWLKHRAYDRPCVGPAPTCLRCED